MDPKSERYFDLPLGLSVADALALLGRPVLIVPRRGGEQWHYEEGRIVLTFAGRPSRLVRIARRPDSFIPSDPGKMRKKAK